MVYRFPYPWYFDPLPMVYRPPYPWYIDPLPIVYGPHTYGILTPNPWYFDPLLTHGLLTTLPIVF